MKPSKVLHTNFVTCIETQPIHPIPNVGMGRMVHPLLLALSIGGVPTIGSLPVWLLPYTSQ